MELLQPRAAAATLYDRPAPCNRAEQRVGLPVTQPAGARRAQGRRDRTTRAGHSLRAIEVLLGTSRRTVAKGLRDAHVSSPPDARDVDGRAALKAPDGLSVSLSLF